MKHPLRQPIVTVLGHVDSGKTSLLDKIRGSSVAAREPGMMTQHIGASFFPLETLEEICGPLSKTISARINIPGILVIDTPGHNVFLNLRRRGGSVSDIAILVIDIIRGFEAQTHESLSILRSRKTPFLVAANKVDLVPGWKARPNATFVESYRTQSPSVQTEVDNLLYTIMGTFSRQGFNAERFDKVKDFAKTVAIIPVSAKTGEGIPELMATLIGLTQQYMAETLRFSEGPAKGTVLEVKEESGLGLTFNAVIYEGILHRTDTIVVGGREHPIVARIRTILLPKPLDEMRDPRDRFTPVESVSAAAGVKIAAPDIEDVIAGAPLYAVGPGQSVEELVKAVADEVERIRIVTDKVGVILKADTLGSLEALTSELENNGIPVRFADVGDVSRREVVEAALIRQTASLLGAILAFNVKVLPDAEEEAKTKGVPIFTENIVYHLIDDYKEWVEKERSAALRKELSTLVLPGKIMVLPTYVFRKSKPAVFGVRVLAGRIRQGYPMIRGDGQRVGTVMQIQDQGQSIEEATIGMEVAVSMREPTIGRSFDEGDVLYVAVPEGDAQTLLTKYQSMLSQDDLEVLKELIEVMRKVSPGWGPLMIPS
jgi:translation initiation factor 5B